MSNKVLYNIYVELDDIFDTRLVLAYMLDEYHMDKYVKSKKYEIRKTDQFGNIPIDVFKKLYKYRTDVLLDYALPTQIPDFINSIIKEELQNPVTFESLDPDNPMKLYVNYYPYKLEKDRLTDIEIYLSTLIDFVEVELVSYSDIELTPHWLKRNCKHVFKYNLLTWLEYHVNNLNIFKDNLISTFCYAPSVLEANLPDSEYLDAIYKIEESYSIYCNLTLLDISLYNSSIRDSKTSLDKEE